MGEREPADSHHVIRDAVYVFEGQFTVNADKAKIVDTVLGLWSICLETQGELLVLVNADRARTFPKEYFGNLPDLLEEEILRADEEVKEESLVKQPTKRPSILKKRRASTDGEIPEPTSLFNKGQAEEKPDTKESRLAA